MSLVDNPKIKNNSVLPIVRIEDNLSQQSNRSGRNADTVQQTIISGPLLVDASVANGELTKIVINYTSNGGRYFLAEFRVQVWVDDPVPANTLFPISDASTLNLADWEIYGPNFSLYDEDDGVTEVPGGQSQWVLALGNISAGTVSTYAAVRLKYIMNRG